MEFKTQKIIGQNAFMIVYRNHGTEKLIDFCLDLLLELKIYKHRGCQSAHYNCIEILKFCSRKLNNHAKEKEDKT